MIVGLVGTGDGVVHDGDSLIGDDPSIKPHRSGEADLGTGDLLDESGIGRCH